MAATILHAGDPRVRAAAICWADSTGARLARWTGDGPTIERIAAAIPPRHVSTGHVRHDPRVRQGGGGAAQDKVERERLEHIRHYVAALLAAVHDDEDVEIVGPTGIREEVAKAIREADRQHGRTRLVGTSAATRLTDAQLVARLRERIGEAPRRVRRGPEH